MLRTLALVLGLTVVAPAVLAPTGLVPAGWVATDAAAQPDPSGFVPPPPPVSTMRQPEHLTARPSGFWTSTRPAEGGAYRYRIMGMGALALAITSLFLVRLLRRANATSVRARKA